MVHPDADLSAEASEISKACSTLRCGRPSTSRHLPEKTFFLPSFGNLSKVLSVYGSSHFCGPNLDCNVVFISIELNLPYNYVSKALYHPEWFLEGNLN